jgi:3D (Asp-Asp-Asp) domain-containing protein
MEIMPSTAVRCFAPLEATRPPHRIARIASAVSALLVGLAFWQPAVTHAQAASCEMYRITGYIRGADSPWTYDGTSVWTSEPIVAASWNVPINSIVQVQGLGAYRVADRGGGLGKRHIDVLVNSKAEAYSLTGWRPVCMLKSGNAKPTVNARAVDRTTSTLSAFVAPTSPRPIPVASRAAMIAPRP